MPNRKNKLLTLRGKKPLAAFLLAFWHCTAFCFQTGFSIIMAASPSGISVSLFWARSKCFCVLLANCDPLSLSRASPAYFRQGRHGTLLFFNQLHPFYPPQQQSPSSTPSFCKNDARVSERAHPERSITHRTPEGNSFQSYYMWVRSTLCSYRGRE